MQVIPIPLFDDNYCYLVHGAKKESSLIVDPADFKTIYDWLQKNSEYTISHILVTHKHWDHAEGVPDLRKKLEEDYQNAGTGKNSKVEIVVGELEKKDYGTINVEATGSFEVNDIRITHIPVPCHTVGHQLYYLEDLNNTSKKNDPEKPKDVMRCVFTGDTLFIGGSGRFFEGNAEQMQGNFDEIRKLPEDTFVFCGHEYTKANYEWATKIYPENESISRRLKWAQQMRDKGLYTIPSTVKDEIDSNIFMMTRDAELQKKFGVSDEVSLMKELRSWKDNKKTFEDKEL